ncbi:MAG: coenzyme F420-0:L-glutamate ligase [Candidatus Cloacimonetes bacterium]|nr:coenzyme F420-0:L-glutamate ligase [Candidatus Cloacimonadota bacterium]
MTINMKQISIIGIPGIPLIQPRDSLGKIIFDATTKAKFQFNEGDIVVVVQKIVSKAENCMVLLDDIDPSPEAEHLSKLTGRDPRLCQVVIDESESIIETTGRMIIVRHRLGFEMSQAGVDNSNVHYPRGVKVATLPKNPDASARKIREELRSYIGIDLAVIISDSLGMGPREGSRGMAIGIAGIAAIEKRNQEDLYGNPSNPQIALVDEIASATSILNGQSSEGIPVVVVRGVEYTKDENASIRDLIIPNWRERVVPYKAKDIL